jgi:pilus assembly protein Flp/PilA
MTRDAQTLGRRLSRTTHENSLKTFPTYASPSRARGGEQMLHGLAKWFISHATRLENERGATAVEYGLMVALIAAIIVATVALLGQDILAAFKTVLDAI